MCGPGCYAASASPPLMTLTVSRPTWPAFPLLYCEATLSVSSHPLSLLLVISRLPINYECRRWFCYLNFILGRGHLTPHATI